MAEASKKKRLRKFLMHRWTDTQLLELIELVVDVTKGNPENFEKPTAQRFYSKIAQSSRHLTVIDWIPMRSKMRYCRVRYLEAARWKSETGAGRLAEGAEKTIAEYIQKMCPHWNLLHALFGQRRSVNPPVVVDSDDLKIEIRSVYDECNEDSRTQESRECTPEPSGRSSGLDFSNCSDSLKSKRGPNLAAMQMKKIELEIEKFQWTDEKESIEIDLKQKELRQDADIKIQFKKWELQHELEVKRLEIEKDERLAMARMKIDAEMAERLTKIELESKKFQWTKEKESIEIDLKQMELRQDADIKIQLKNLELQHDLEVKRLEIEKDERLAMARMKIDTEMAERLKKIELELQIKRNM